MKADPSEVWAVLADLQSHDQWMKDAEKIEFESDSRSGTGTVMRVETRVGPLRTSDVIEVTGWTEGESIDVIHRGLVRGTGVLSMSEVGGDVRVDWIERLQFPWWLGGPITAFLAKPVLAAIWRGNLRRLEESLSYR